MVSFFKVVGVIFALLLVVFFVGPRPDTNQTVTFDPSAIGQDIDAYLADAESRYNDLRDGVAKEIIWADPVSKQVTEFAFVYIHGFSATKRETAPVTQNVASALGGNVFMTRLSGHGRSGNAMAEPAMSDWLNDVVEAINIGKRLGRKVILVSGSTGGTLSTWAAAQPEFADSIAGMILISPNYAIHGASTGLMNMPWAETLLPMILGAERKFEPSSEDHGKFWTSSYPSKAVFPMAALLRVVEGIDKRTITIPALFIYSDQDKVVVADQTDRVVEAWGGATEVLKINNSVDPYSHVIAGDILSPNTTERVTNAIIDWLKAL